MLSICNLYVSVEISEPEMLNNLKGGNVVSVRRMGNPQNGKNSPPVLLVFKEDELPKKVSLGYLIYPVGPYERATLRCFNCQRYGHVAVVCRGRRRCTRCGEDHDGKECNKDMKCPNCGGEHIASFEGAQIR